MLKERQKKREQETEELRIRNEQKQKRKEMIKEKYLKKLEERRQELSEKLRIEQEKADAYERQKEVVLEHKYTNQMIDQMKVQYYKDLHYNMKIQNKFGPEEFDKMVNNLKAIPEEDCREDAVEPPDPSKLKKRINSAFGFAMKQFKLASNIKPIRSQKALSITARGNTSSQQKTRRAGRGGSMVNSNIHKVYSNTQYSTSTKPSQPKLTKKLSERDGVKAAKNIFITGIKDEPDKPDFDQEDKDNQEKPEIHTEVREANNEFVNNKATTDEDKEPQPSK